MKLILTSPKILLLGKSQTVFAFALTYSYLWLTPKILPLGNVQINLTLPSLIRIFVLLFYPAEPRRPVPAEGDAVQ